MSVIRLVEQGLTPMYNNIWRLYSIVAGDNAVETFSQNTEIPNNMVGKLYKTSMSSILNL